jgi:hypothetical protein
MAAFMLDRTAGCSRAGDPSAPLGVRARQIEEAQLLAKETRMWLVIGTWLSVAVAAFAACIRAGAPLSTRVAVSIACLAPGGVALIIGMSVPSLPIGAWLHTPDGE